MNGCSRCRSQPRRRRKKHFVDSSLYVHAPQRSCEAHSSQQPCAELWTVMNFGGSSRPLSITTLVVCEQSAASSCGMPETTLPFRSVRASRSWRVHARRVLRLSLSILSDFSSSRTMLYCGKRRNG